MSTQPHLLLLQKTMVMEEGVAHALDPDINMWETAEPFLREWVRSELGPEAALADRLVRDFRTFARLPELIRRLDYYYPPPGAAPPDPPLPDVVVVTPHRYGFNLLLMVSAAAAGAAAMFFLT
jgi:ubiquinone biosynthesis protein